MDENLKFKPYTTLIGDNGVYAFKDGGAFIFSYPQYKIPGLHVFPNFEISGDIHDYDFQRHTQNINPQKMKDKKEESLKLINKLNVKDNIVFNLFNYSVEEVASVYGGQVIYDTQRKDFQLVHVQNVELPVVKLHRYSSNIDTKAFLNGMRLLAFFEESHKKTGLKSNIKLPDKRKLTYFLDYVHDKRENKFLLDGSPITLEEFFGLMRHFDLSKEPITVLKSVNPPEVKKEKVKQNIISANSDTNKITLLKSDIKNILKNMPNGDVLTLFYNSGNKSFDIKKIDKNILEFDTNKFPYKKYPYLINKYKDLNNPNYQCTFKDFGEEFNFAEKLFMIEDNKKKVEEYQKFNKDKELGKSKDVIKEQNEKEKYIQLFKNSRTLLKEFPMKLVKFSHEQQAEDEKILNRELTNKEFLYLLYFKNIKFWDILEKTLKDFDFINVKRDSDYGVVFEFNGYPFKISYDYYIETTYRNDKPYIRYEFPFGEKAHDKNYKFVSYDPAKDIEPNSKKFKFLKFENLSSLHKNWEILGNGYNWHYKDSKENFEIRREYTGTKYSTPNKLVFTHWAYQHDIFDKFLLTINNSIKNDFNIGIKDLNVIKNKKYNHDKIVYVTDDDFKEPIKIVKEDEKYWTGEFYDYLSGKHLKIKFEKSTRESIDPKYSHIKILPLEFKRYTYKNFDWSRLPKNINKLYRNPESDSWLGTERNNVVHYNPKNEKWEHKVMGRVEYKLNDLYNFEITDFPDNFTFEKEKPQTINFEQIARDKGQTSCHCGCIDTEPVYFNGDFQGFMCSEHKKDFVYENTTFLVH